MKIGIILSCYNIEDKINLSTIMDVINTNGHLHFCFVNNGSSDNTMNILEYLSRESGQDISVLDLKKKKTSNAVAKVGSRYLNTKEEIDYVQSVLIDFTMNQFQVEKALKAQVLKEHEFYENDTYKFRLKRIRELK
jgi:glycosyltransferase involved in cell wall biosynthesis